MQDRERPGPHMLHGWLMIAYGLGVTGVMTIVAVVSPSLGWLQYPPAVGAPLVQSVVLLLGLALLAAAFGFVRFHRWAWWIVAIWGLWSAVELARSALANLLDITISFPRLVAVFLLLYAWRRRRDFGVRFRGEDS